MGEETPPLNTMFEYIDESNFFLYAARHYDNHDCVDVVEFYEDLNRIKYLKRLFNKYEESGELKERLVLNHLIVLYNTFGDATTQILFFKLKGYYEYLKPFLVLLCRMPDKIYGIGDKPILNTDIHMDNKIVNILRDI
jgi:hypothetical protein